MYVYSNYKSNYIKNSYVVILLFQKNVAKILYILLGLIFVLN